VLQEATDIYKALLLDHRDLLALNVYVALCYAKLDYYDVSSEILQVLSNSAVQCSRAVCCDGSCHGGSAMPPLISASSVCRYDPQDGSSCRGCVV
jgi:hypothetical protein